MKIERNLDFVEWTKTTDRRSTDLRKAEISIAIPSKMINILLTTYDSVFCHFHLTEKLFSSYLY